MSYANVLNDGAALGGAVAAVGPLATVRFHLRVNASVAFEVGVALKGGIAAVEGTHKLDMFRLGVLVHQVTDGGHKVAVITTALEDALLVLLKLVRHKGKVAVEFDRADGAGKVSVSGSYVRPKVLSEKGD